MAALVQTLPPQTTVTMLPGRPSSSGGSFSNQPSQMRSHHQPRYSNQSGSGYRGMPATGPVAPYAFTSTPQLAMGPRPQAPNSGRSSSSSNVSQLQQRTSPPSLPTSFGLPPVDAGNRLSLGLSFSPSGALITTAPILPPPTSTTSTPSSPTISLAPTSAKPSPDRYRRNVRRGEGENGPNRVAGSALPSGSGMAAVGSLYSQPSQSSSTPSLTSQHSYRGTVHSNASSTSADDLTLARGQDKELAARYRRRSLGSLETSGLQHSADKQDTPSPHPNAFLQTASIGTVHQQHVPNHSHTASSDSVASSRSTPSRPGSATGSVRTERSAINAATSPAPGTTSQMQDSRYTTTVRAVDTGLRQPSPLSRPTTFSAEDAQQRPPIAQGQRSPQAAPVSAVEQLSAITQNDTKKRSKLRRAFSFGSAAELRKATAQANHEKSLASKTPIQAKRSSKYEDELEPEQARIAEKQEAAGLGESIYSGQGQFFTGSTDNLSISSTASSASIMLRKMGQGVKKGTRSLVGLFRPKSVVGVPPADSPVSPVNQFSTAQVSMITVEAERENVNVNLDPHGHPGGGTGYPRLERNSIDAKLSFDSPTVSSDSRSRRSIVGGEKERAEVLAAVKKGILKRTDSNQPSPKVRAVDLNLPNIPHANDTPRSSAPSTPADDPPRSGHRRTDSITIEGNDHEDYFSVTRYASMDSKTGTPQGVIRNISFSPRLQFHDTWPSQEYDRRGEISTCNRLTPMLAQQIKEELNSFKMEMEVHESSKVYTHFF